MTWMLTTIALLACLAIPSVALGNLANDPVIFTSGDWAVRKSIDTMTDKVSCTALYLNRFDVQLGRESFFIVMRGRGGVKAYTIRLDDNPAGEMQIPSKVEKDISSFGIRGPLFRELLGARRLRAKVLTLLSSSVQEDISLLGAPEAFAVISGPECKQP